MCIVSSSDTLYFLGALLLVHRTAPQCDTIIAVICWCHEHRQISVPFEPVAISIWEMFRMFAGLSLVSTRAVSQWTDCCGMARTAIPNQPPFSLPFLPPNLATFAQLSKVGQMSQGKVGFAQRGRHVAVKGLKFCLQESVRGVCSTDHDQELSEENEILSPRVCLLCFKRLRTGTDIAPHLIAVELAVFAKPQATLHSTGLVSTGFRGVLHQHDVVHGRRKGTGNGLSLIPTDPPNSSRTACQRTVLKTDLFWHDGTDSRSTTFDVLACMESCTS